MQDFFGIFFILIFGHCLADYPLQSDFLAKAKDRYTPVGSIFWIYALSAHGIIHGGFVFIFTGSLYMGIAEAIIHSFVDWLKCEGKITLREDQFIHFTCKLVWAFLYVIEQYGNF